MPDRRQGVDFSKWVVPILPVLFAAVAWLIQSIADQDKRILELKGQMMMLIDPNGQIIPSPDNQIARGKLREEVMNNQHALRESMISHIHDLQVRIKLLETHDIHKRKSSGQ